MRRESETGSWLVLGRATGNSVILPNQILLARNHIKLLFASGNGHQGS